MRPLPGTSPADPARPAPALADPAGAASNTAACPEKLAYFGLSPLDEHIEAAPGHVLIIAARPGGRASEHQLDYLARQRSRGHLAFVADSVEVVVAELTREGFKVPPVRGRVA